MRYILYLLVLLFVGCSPYRGLRKQELSFVQRDTSFRISVLIPRGARRTQGTDTAGNTFYSFKYKGAGIHFNPGSQFKSLGLDTADHVGKPQFNGGLSYKEQSDNGKFQRDVLLGRLWYGYRNADPWKQEGKLDSVLNSVRRQE